MKKRTTLFSLLASTLVMGSLAGTHLLATVRSSKFPEESLRPLVEQNTAFALDLKSHLLAPSPDENLLFSPYSIFTSLSMTYVGAKEETAASMKQALHLNMDIETLSHSTRSLAKHLAVFPSEGCPLSLKIANGIFADRDTMILPKFRNLIEKNFQAEIQDLDFSEETLARQIINEWTSNQTEHKIKDLLQPGDIDSLTRMVLINAIYFKGAWAFPFNPKQTEKAPFHVDFNRSTEVDMMAQIEQLYYCEQDSAQIVALPFKTCDSQTSLPALLIVLPSSQNDFIHLEKKLTSDMIRGWLSELKPTHVGLHLPRFCLKQRFDLNTPLKELGMGIAFSERANFSGIDGSKDLFLSKVVHEAFFDLNEHGLEAAAATSASISLKSAPPSVPPIYINANRPFLFFLVDLKTGAPLFMGRLCDPSIGGC